MRQLRTVQLLALTDTALPAEFCTRRPSNVTPSAVNTTIDPTLLPGRKPSVWSGLGSLWSLLKRSSL